VVEDRVLCENGAVTFVSNTVTLAAPTFGSKQKTSFRQNLDPKREVTHS
jgi:hypothetical protein